MLKTHPNDALPPRRPARCGWRVSWAMILALAAAVASAPADEGQRGGKSVKRQRQDFGFSGNYALLVGVTDYTAGWDDLPQIQGELDEVEKTLKNRGFEVVRVNDPDHEQLRNAFEDFINRYGYQESHRLLFFYAGHGYSLNDQGYLVAADAPDPRDDKVEFRRRSLAMTQILAWARIMGARHALFLFDSCFSGSVFKSRGLGDLPPRFIREEASRPVRQFITAGSANETVPAKSVFTPSFVRALEGEGDTDGNGYVTGTELGMHLKRKVLDYDSGQTPQYGKIKDPDWDRGDYVFALHDLLAVKTLERRRAAALDIAKDNLGVYVTGSMLDDLKRLLDGELPLEQLAELLDEIEALDGNTRSQRSFNLYFEESREGLLSSLATVDKKPEAERQVTPPPARLKMEQSAPRPVIAKAMETERVVRDPIPPPPPPPRKPDPVVTIERRIPGLAPGARLAAVMTTVEEALPLGPKNLRAIGAFAWALDYYSTAGGDAQQREEAARLRRSLFESLPPPVMPRDGWVDIPAGKLVMGGRGPHETELSGFRMLDHEVTGREYRALVARHRGDDTQPAVGVSWYSAYAYAAWLGGRLPTEAEWEYAAVAGCRFEYCDAGGEEAILDDVAWWSSNASRRLQAVRQRKPNPWGLYDMIGNAAEWVADFSAPYPDASRTDPWGPPGGRERVARGGSYMESGLKATPVSRGGFLPSTERLTLGFRVVLPGAPAP